jgi:hypothetical protein
VAKRPRELISHPVSVAGRTAALSDGGGVVQVLGMECVAGDVADAAGDLVVLSCETVSALKGVRGLVFVSGWPVSVNSRVDNAGRGGGGCRMTPADFGRCLVEPNQRCV